MDSCTKLMTLPIESGSRCNGHQSCEYDFPEFITLPCNRSLKAESTRINYDCIPDEKILDMCVNRTLKGNSVYLMSPGYPLGLEGSGRCQCQALGTDMRVMILQLTADPSGDYVLNAVGDNVHKQLNSVEVFHKEVFPKVSSVNFTFTYSNKTRRSLSRFWWRLDHATTDITLECGGPQDAPHIPSPPGDSDTTTASIPTTTQKVVSTSTLSTTDTPPVTVASSTEKTITISLSKTPSETSSSSPITLTTSSTTAEVTLKNNISTNNVSEVTSQSELTYSPTTPVTSESEQTPVSATPLTSQPEQTIRPTTPTSNQSKITPTIVPETNRTTTAAYAIQAAMQQKNVDEVALYVGIGVAIAAVVAIIIVTVVCFRRKSTDKQQHQTPQVNGNVHLHRDSEEVYSVVKRSTRAGNSENLPRSLNNSVASGEEIPVVPPKTELAYVPFRATSTTRVESRATNSGHSPQQTSVLNHNRESDLQATMNIGEDSASDNSITPNSNGNIRLQNQNKSEKRKHVVTISIENDNPYSSRRNSDSLNLMHTIDGRMLQSHNHGEESTESFDMDREHSVNFASGEPKEIPTYEEIRLSYLHDEGESTENPCYESYDLNKQMKTVHVGKGILKK
ncbi:hypothetical protein ScPMuIL_013150 [Solemya velum]